MKNRPEPKDDDDNFSLSPPPSPARLPSLGPQHPWQPLGPPPANLFVPPPSGRFLELLQQPTAQPRHPPPLKPKSFIDIPLAPSAPPLSASDYFLLGPSARSVSPPPGPLAPTAPPLQIIYMVLKHKH